MRGMRGSEGQRPHREGQFCLLGSLCPRGLHAQHCLGIPLPTGRAPALVTCRGEPRFLLQGGPSSHPWVRDRSMAPATRQPQSQHEQKAQTTAAGKWVVKRGSLLAKGQEGPVQNKGGTVHQQATPGGGLSQPRNTRLLARNNGMCRTYTRHSQSW